jgi:3-phenylpropionate/trans-cinnamate dioxygenase ferredoxin reductase subunit
MTQVRSDADPITIVGQEEHSPYERPPLSKAFLSGEVTAENLAFRTSDFYRDQQIDLALGETIVDGKTETDGTGWVSSLSGRRFEYSQLALAVGASPRRLDVEGSELDGVVYLRDASDAVDLRRRFQEPGPVVVLGSGLIGMEVAASARKMGKEVTVISSGSRPMSRSVGPATGEVFAAEFAARGVKLLLNTDIVRLHGDDKSLQSVELVSGQQLDAATLVVGIGAQPRTTLATKLGLATSVGILVDERGFASNGMTIAVGDCAEGPSPLIALGGPKHLRHESVNNAVEQAKAAAAAVTGSVPPRRGAPWYWSDQFDLKLQVVGESSWADRTVIRGSLAERKFTVLSFAAGNLIGAECVNNAPEFLALRSAMTKGQKLDPDAAGDSAVQLKSLLSSPDVGTALPAL